jgi:hydroxymethylpyrimidine pyrophosphatase-like HAD family hydrolase
MTRCRLLALDLDGTLLRDDGTVDAEDRRAVARARAHDVLVTLATGRLPRTTLPWARALHLGAPLICADGALTVAPNGGRLALRTLPPPAIASFWRLGESAQLPTLWLTGHAVRGLGAHAELAGWLAGWSDHFVALPGHGAHVRAPARSLAGFLLGTEDEITRLRAAFEASVPAHELTIDQFALGATGPWALRIRPGHCDKGSALCEVARRLGIRREQVAVVGDWYNDVPMFGWAGRSFAMGHAPDPVAHAASRRLTATSATGGGVAEAVHLLERAHHIPERHRTGWA